MNIDDFYKRFGRDSTTNFQLERHARELKIPNFYVCMRDEINQLPRNMFPLNVIVNIHTQKSEVCTGLRCTLTKTRYFSLTRMH